MTNLNHSKQLDEVFMLLMRKHLRKPICDHPACGHPSDSALSFPDLLMQPVSVYYMSKLCVETNILCLKQTNCLLIDIICYSLYYSGDMGGGSRQSHLISCRSLLHIRRSLSRRGQKFLFCLPHSTFLLYKKVAWNPRFSAPVFNSPLSF